MLIGSSQFRLLSPIFFLLFDSFIPPKLSFLLWRFLHGCLPTDDKLLRCGVLSVSDCLLCSNFHCAKSGTHPFFECDFAGAIFRWLARCSSRLNPVISAYGFCSILQGLHKSSHVDNLWLLGYMTVFKVIWKEHNDQRFNNLVPSVFRSISMIHALLWIIFQHCPGVASSTFNKGVLQYLGISPNFMKP